MGGTVVVLSSRRMAWSRGVAIAIAAAGLTAGCGRITAVDLELSSACATRLATLRVTASAAGGATKSIVEHNVRLPMSVRLLVADHAATVSGTIEAIGDDGSDRTLPFHATPQAGVIVELPIALTCAVADMAVPADLATPRLWQSVNVGGPSARHSYGAVYDAQRHVVVLVGGVDASGVVGDTWEWSGTAWTERLPITPAPPRRGFALAYDGARQRVLFFGGDNGPGSNNDTWDYDGNTWREIMPAHAPSPRQSLSMAFDSARGVVVLFGGFAKNGVSYADTWEWNGSDWTQRMPTRAPPARQAHRLVYDEARGVTLLLGGVANPDRLDDFWQYDGSNWTQLASGPPARGAFGMAYDSARHTTIVFGGSPQWHGVLGDAWQWDGAAWQKLDGNMPASRRSIALAFDAARGQLVLFGGNIGGGSGNGVLVAETWLY
jgi:hypothetical protein